MGSEGSAGEIEPSVGRHPRRARRSWSLLSPLVLLGVMTVPSGAYASDFRPMMRLLVAFPAGVFLLGCTIWMLIFRSKGAVYVGAPFVLVLVSTLELRFGAVWIAALLIALYIACAWAVLRLPQEESRPEGERDSKP